MKILTDAQANEIIRLLLDLEKASVKEQAIVDAERIRAIISASRASHSKA